MGFETLFILLVLMYVLAHALAFALTEPESREHSRASAEEHHLRRERRSRLLTRRLIGAGSIAIGLAAAAKGLLLLMGPAILARMPAWIRTLANVGQPLTDVIPALLYIGLGWWVVGWGVAGMTARTRKRRSPRRRPAGTTRTELKAGGERGAT